ncbi:hypothetical protein EJ08DRAFT_135675 [Tothia fuscella]|uniref:F-box domain-containing protein n=1 Tax=Tothia fuscella TaxID=1048955 RepID=A0A9P4NDM8_9PEZI|nr:hypothetical protein EJ08DRAFT_135675 [Tothia fuscella]
MGLPCKQYLGLCVVHHPHGSKYGNQKAWNWLHQIRQNLTGNKRQKSVWTRQENRMTKLPTEILLLICQNLAPNARAAFALSARYLAHRLGPEFWSALRRESNSDELILFLQLLQKDISNTYVCFGCRKLHTYSSGRLSVFSVPNGLRQNRLEAFYTLQSSHIKACLAQRGCIWSMTCASMRMLYFRSLEPIAVVVWCRPRRINQEVMILNRHYIIPLAQKRITNSPTHETSKSKVSGLRICPHVHFNRITDQSFPPLCDPTETICSSGAAWSGFTSDIRRYRRDDGYKHELSCPKCRTEMYMAKRDEYGNMVCDIYHILRRGKREVFNPVWGSSRLKDMFEEAGSPNEVVLPRL